MRNDSSEIMIIRQQLTLHENHLNFIIEEDKTDSTTASVFSRLTLLS